MFANTTTPPLAGSAQVMRSASARPLFRTRTKVQRCALDRLTAAPKPAASNLKGLTRADFRSLARLAADFRLVSAAASGQNFVLAERAQRVEATLSQRVIALQKSRWYQFRALKGPISLLVGSSREPTFSKTAGRHLPPVCAIIKQALSDNATEARAKFKMRPSSREHRSL